MDRNVFIVSATQIVTSDSNPAGLFSTVPGFPKIFDSGTSGDVESSLKAAKAAYHAQLSTNYGNQNPTRVMMTVTLETATGDQLLAESVGGFPEISPEPTPEPEPEEEPEEG